jgi:hypothetical protein
MMLDGSRTLEEVKNISSQITVPELNALLYASVAARATGKNNQQTATADFCQYFTK